MAPSPSEHNGSDLRPGWTTGACAAAAAKAAYFGLVTGRIPASAAVTLPKGHVPEFPIARDGWRDQATPWAAVIKDAGDDPDVTHGAPVIAAIWPGPPASGVTFRAGPGVGTVTLPGLPLAVGEPAINPAPRRIIAGAVGEARAAVGGPQDVVVEVAIEGGETLAAETWNPRLGITGGLSVLGTVGVVVPYSCSAWIHSIHRGIDVARANGYRHVLAAAGRTSETALHALYPGYPATAVLDMGDFAGGLLKYLRKNPVPALTIGGGFGKLTKLAQGERDLHARRSAVDRAALLARLAKLGADTATQARAAESAGAGGILAVARAAGLPLGDAIAESARQVAAELAGSAVSVEVVVVDRGGALVGRAPADRGQDAPSERACMS